MKTMSEYKSIRQLRDEGARVPFDATDSEGDTFIIKIIEGVEFAYGTKEIGLMIGDIDEEIWKLATTEECQHSFPMGDHFKGVFTCSICGFKYTPEVRRYDGCDPELAEVFTKEEKSCEGCGETFFCTDECNGERWKPKETDPEEEYTLASDLNMGELDPKIFKTDGEHRKMTDKDRLICQEIAGVDPVEECKHHWINNGYHKICFNCKAQK